MGLKADYTLQQINEFKNLATETIQMKQIENNWNKGTEYRWAVG